MQSYESEIMQVDGNVNITSIANNCAEFFNYLEFWYSYSDIEYNSQPALFVAIGYNWSILQSEGNIAGQLSLKGLMSNS